MAPAEMFTALQTRMIDAVAVLETADLGVLHALLPGTNLQIVNNGNMSGLID